MLFKYRPRAQLGIFLTLALTACLKRGPASGLKVVGGNDDQSSFPSTVQLVFNNLINCTGTFVKPDLIITAAHCFNPSAAGNAHSVTINSIFTGPMTAHQENFFVHPEYDRNKSVDANVMVDVGFIRLSSANTPLHAVAKIASSRISNEESVVMLGYGHSSFTPGANGSKNTNLNGVGTRRLGRNKVHDFRKDGAILIGGAAQNSEAAEKGASILPGDSGGALYRENGEIVGLVSAHTYNQQFHSNVSIFLDVTGRARSFIDSQLAASEETGQSVENNPSACSYEDAHKHNGWGYNKSTGQSCPPSDPNKNDENIANSNVNSNSDCSYEDAGKYNGWGYNRSTGESCPPIERSYAGNGNDNCKQEEIRTANSMTVRMVCN